MHGLKIYLANGTYNGTVTMSSDSSKISAIRVARENIKDYENELDGPGIYLLLIGSESVYVGQTGLDTINKRIFKTHSGNIDASWHTVLGFKFTDPHIGSNELHFIENAMCEYAHANFEKCLTISPQKGKCTKNFRNKHYHLGGVQIRTCEKYIADIQFYIDFFPEGIFAFKQEKRQREILHMAGKKVSANAYIEGDKFIVCQGSEFSMMEKPSCPKGIRALRKQLLAEHKVQNGYFTEDVSFNSSSMAAECVMGSSVNGQRKWLYPDNKSIKEREEWKK